MSFFEPQTDLPRLIVQDASKRSNGLSRNRVPSSGEYSASNVPTLPNSNYQRRQKVTAKILASEIRQKVDGEFPDREGRAGYD